MTVNIKPKDIQHWSMYLGQVKNGWHLSDNDSKELIRLNHIIMEASHAIHNNNMLKEDK